MYLSLFFKKKSVKSKVCVLCHCCTDIILSCHCINVTGGYCWKVSVKNDDDEDNSGGGGSDDDNDDSDDDDDDYNDERMSIAIKTTILIETSSIEIKIKHNSIDNRKYNDLQAHFCTKFISTLRIEVILSSKMFLTTYKTTIHVVTTKKTTNDTQHKVLRFRKYILLCVVYKPVHVHHHSWWTVATLCAIHLSKSCL